MEEVDVAVVGAGAAGLATAIFAAGAGRVVLIEGAAKPGAKILISGGGRCNVTNRVVTERDYWGGSRNTIKRVLAAFPAERASAFFRDLGVALHEEENGKLYPDSNSARTVLEALLGEAKKRGVKLLSGCRVTSIAPGFLVRSATGDLRAKRVVLASGGRSIPKSGSDGAGYEFAKALGHSVTATTPALDPLILAEPLHAGLAGVTHDVELTVHADPPVKIAGSMLWTHFGVSGPAPLNVSRHWHRGAPRVTANFAPGIDVEERLLDRTRPTAQVATIVAEFVPSRLAEALAPKTTMSHLTKDQRRALVSALTEYDLRVTGSRGWNTAEVTAGGVPLDEIDPRTMESRKCPGLHLVGEILDVDGRLGGFNFQWAWSSGYVAGCALAGTP